MSGEDSDTVKAQVTTKMVETDDLSYVKVAPDQVCVDPLIPLKNPTRQMDWDVAIGKGVIYNPRNRAGIYGNTIEIGYGARINGSLFGRNKITIDSGMSKNGPTFFYGNITSGGDLVIAKPKKKMKDYQDGSVIINGNVVGKNVNITSPAIIRGNIVAEQNISISEGTMVYGVIYSRSGKVSVEGISAYSIIAGNAKKRGEHAEESAREGIRIGKGVSLLVPFLWVKNIDPNVRPVWFKEPVRVISTECRNCGAGKSTAAIMKCKSHLGGNCDKFISIEESDAIPFQQGVILTSVWRTCNEPPEEHDLISSIIDEMLMEVKKEEEIIHSFVADEYGNFGTISDFAPKIEQNIQQTVFQGDYIAQKIDGDLVTGSKVDIRDSVVTGSQIGTSSGGQGDGGHGGKFSVKDSVVSKSSLQENADLQDSAVINTPEPKKKERAKIPKGILDEIGSADEPEMTPQGISNYLRTVIKKAAQLHNKGVDVTAYQDMLKDAREALGSEDLDAAYLAIKKCENAMKRHG